jgi:hypothetical protein
MEGSEPAPSTGPGLVNSVEPGTDLAPLPIDFPGDETMRISHEAIYQALSSRAAGRSSVNSWHVYALGVRCGLPVLVLSNPLAVTSLTR